MIVMLIKSRHYKNGIVPRFLAYLVNSKRTPDSLEVDVFLFIIEYPVIEILDSISETEFVDSDYRSYIHKCYHLSL